jgi:2-polyprenyl-6-hydroxyphenyl methylase/3-demethylubiquinone-9 3-methyltransferase
MEEKVTFSFGKNWKKYLKNVTNDQIRDATGDIQEWLGNYIISGKSVLDIGSGSGIHSYAFHLLGVEKVDSFDYDHYSIEATRDLWEKSGKPVNWSVFQGSILDDNFIENLPDYDIVYSWGVLHHTGDMWKAIQNAGSKVRLGGLFWISIYAKGPNYSQHLKLKRKYNSSSNFTKTIMVYDRIWRRRIFGNWDISFIPTSFNEVRVVIDILYFRIKHYKTEFRWNEKNQRGMDSNYDIIDWLGGLPYEVASPDEVITFCNKLGFKLEKIKEAKEGSCCNYLFKKENKI